MLCKVTTACYTSDCRLLQEGDVIEYDGEEAARPRYYQPLTEFERMRFMAQATDAQLEMANGKGAIVDDVPLNPTPEREHQMSAAVANQDRSAIIHDALAKMDHDDDEQWTGAGLPLMDVVCVLAQDDSITRAELQAYAPEYQRKR